MRRLVICDGNDELNVIAEARRKAAKSNDRIIILTSRTGSAWENGAVLSIPLRWALTAIPSPFWRQRDRLRKAITLVAGLRSARFFSGIEDLLLQIDACDPDLVDLRRLGAFGQWLGPKCALRFPGRKVVINSDDDPRDEHAARWRNYDRTALVSIVLPTYNSERYLSLSIESCLKQTHENFELIIVDDNSTDRTPEIIRTYADQDSRITFVIRKQIQPGLPESLNLGFSRAQGRFLTWAQSDNLYTPAAIEYMVQQLCTFPEVGLVYCSAHHIDDAGNGIATPSFFNATFPPNALARWTVIGGAFLYRREVMDQVGPYRPECRYFEDLDFFIRACMRFPAKYYVEPCHFYRRHSGSLTSAHSDHGRKWKIWHRKMRDEHFKSGRHRIVLPTADQLIPKAFRASI
jgi:GT2 family glycosyltransferase